MNTKTNMNIVVEELRSFGFRLRTQWEKSEDGTVRGNGFYSSSDRTATIHQMGNTARGSCVAESLALYKKFKHLEPKVINGELRSLRNEWKMVDEARGMPIYHCWIEIGDKVYDFSNGERIIADKDIYYLCKRVGKTIELTPTTIKGGEYYFDKYEDQRRTKFYKTIRKNQRALGYDCGF